MLKQLESRVKQFKNNGQVINCSSQYGLASEHLPEDLKARAAIVPMIHPAGSCPRNNFNFFLLSISPTQDGVSPGRRSFPVGSTFSNAPQRKPTPSSIEGL
ncbi:hypothetical protein AWENTII_008924 [Aspergillus wentii]